MTEDIGARFTAGVQSRIEGRYDDAEAHLKAVIAAQPTNADAHHELGLVYSFIVHDDCLKELEAAVRLNPDSITFLITLAKTRTMFGEYPEAKALFERVLAMDPFNEEANKNLEFISLV